jgi:dCMP deaminase
MTSTERWDGFFMRLCREIGGKSKDPHTQFGAVLAYPDNGVCSTGFNGFPRGVNEAVPVRWERPAKYYFAEHAERNAILNAARHGHRTEGCTLYVNGLPCADCARAMIQAGIVRVVCLDLASDVAARWQESHGAGVVMLAEAGVKVDVIKAEKDIEGREF